MIEALTIRVLHVFHAFRLKRTPGLCPPACGNGHTYTWPCRARFATGRRWNWWRFWA